MRPGAWWTRQGRYDRAVGIMDEVARRQHQLGRGEGLGVGGIPKERVCKSHWRHDFHYKPCYSAIQGQPTIGFGCEATEWGIYDEFEGKDDDAG